jgi:hypothetical protein
LVWDFAFEKYGRSETYSGSFARSNDVSQTQDTAGEETSKRVNEAGERSVGRGEVQVIYLVGKGRVTDRKLH